MHILCVGISHRTAPVELRERVAMDAGQMDAALAELRKRYAGAELAILSTCNRTELYIARPLHGHPRVEEVIDYLASSRGVERERLASAAYHLDNERAIGHLHRVASGLDSMVLGEAQVLGQVKGAYERAQAAGTAGRVLHTVMRSAIQTAKRVRSETRIGAGRTSVSSVAVDFARHLFGRFDDKTVLTLGAGKMAELTLGYFLELKPRRLLVCNRTAERAEQLAGKYGGEAVAFDALADHLVAADVVISSTGAGEPIVDGGGFRPLVKRRRFRPLFVIDIAVPRDFHPEVADLPNVYLYNLDDLQGAIAEQLSARNGEAAACEPMIERAVAETYAAVQTEDFGELIRRLRERLHRIGDAEARRTLNKLRSSDAERAPQIIEEHTYRVVNKILHRPISELGRGRGTRAALYATALRRLFELDAGAEDLDPPESRE